MAIHSTAIISEQARIDPRASVGPFCVIEGKVDIGAHTIVESHARIGHEAGRVVIGEHNLVQHGAVLGGAPQDLSYTDADTCLTIGDHNRIGEYVSISRGTEKGGGETRIGNRTMLMAFVHIGHDCQIEDHVIITNGTQLAGHVEVHAHALLSGLAGATQFVRFGRFSFLTAGAFANKDIPPFTIAEGHWARPRVVNRIALKRAGMSAETRRNIEQAVRLLLDLRFTIDEVVDRIKSECAPSEMISYLCSFLRTSSRGVARR